MKPIVTTKYGPSVVLQLRGGQIQKGHKWGNVVLRVKDDAGD